jgi:hypothetical protein
MAFPLGEGRICRITHLVELEEANARQQEGWWLIGPDPVDWHNLEQWEAAQWPRPWSKW